MDRLTLACIILIIMLFAGIGIMMGPAKINAIFSGRSNSPMLGALILLASLLTVTGLVGIGVMGFIISKR